jgi:dihydroflavonol-4-reductase
MIVVTGATGHIGNVLTRKLLKSGEKVRAVIPAGEDIRSLEGLELERVEGDLRDLESLIQAFDGARMVYHLAGIITILPGQDDFLYQVNVEGTRNVVDACIENDVERLVYTSSVHALEEPPKGTVIDETCPYGVECARGGYDRTKAQASLEVLKGVKKGLDAVMVCPSGVIGPYDYRISQMGQLILTFMKGNLRAYIDGAYDFVDVRDVAEGLILAGEKGECGESYILSGERITVPELMLTLEDITGVKAPSLKLPLWLVRIASRASPIYYNLTKSKPLFTAYSTEVLVSNSEISSEKARQELGYSPRPIRESIKDSVEWFRENGSF